MKQENESKYQKIFENVQDIFYQTDLNGAITEISPSISRYSTYLNTDLIGQPIEQFYYYPEERQTLLSEIEKKGEIFDYELLLRGENNQKIWASINVHFIFDKTGQIAGTEGTVRDITKRKQTEEKLKLSLSALQATLDSTADGILVVDKSGKITNYNKQFKTIFNIPDEIFESGDDAAAIQFILSLLNSPEQFVSKVQFLYDNPELDSFDTIEFKDGRVMERFSCPQQLDGEPVGRVWNFRDVTIRKQDELQLKESEERYRSFFEGSPDAIILADTETGLIIDANLASAALLKKPLNEIIGMHQTMLHPKRNEEYSRTMFQYKAAKSNQTNIPKSTENLVVCSDGIEVPVEIMANIVHIKGKPVLQGVFRDISERKLAEKMIRESENRFRMLIENQGVGISVVDPDENFIFANPAAETILGVRPGTLLHRNLREFIIPDQFERILQETKRRAQNEKSNYEVDIVTHDGEKRTLFVTATPQIDDEGRFTGTLGVYHDITARKQAEEKLRLNELKYRNLIETMPDGVYRSTHEGEFVEVNPAMVNILGYGSKEELMNIDIKTQLYFSPEDRESMALIINNAELGVFPLRKKDGSTVWLEDHGWHITDENGKIIFHEGILRDVTERKMAEMQFQKYSEELKELNATKDKFFSIIAHDLKSPFNGISGLSEIMKDEAKYLDTATIEQYAELIHSTSQNAYQLLENLLDWARVQQSRMPFRPEALLLKRIVSEVVELLCEKASSKKITLTNAVPENMIVKADENMLKTIIRNLVSNALKFTSTNGTIGINAVSYLNETEISVKDTGIGIKKDDIGKIFKIDSNFSRPGTENEKGTGLGLLLCKEFVEKHGGEFRVESEEGKGSTFSFTINQNGMNC